MVERVQDKGGGVENLSRRFYGYQAYKTGELKLI
jgi:hypothetical protein